MGPYRGAVEELRFDRALDEVWLTVRSLNQYLESVKPWEIAKKRESDPEAEAHLAEVLGHAVKTLLQVGDMLVPFLPETAAAIEKTFASGVVVPVEREGGIFPKIYNHTPSPHTAKA
jgi:methionyl-tRNA synthetase